MLKKNKKSAAKYSSVSVDGTTPITPSSAINDDIANKKLSRAVKNSEKNTHTSKRTANDEKQTERVVNETRIIDDRYRESVDVIKSFLNYPADSEFGVNEMVNEFLKLIKNYIKLHDEHQKLLYNLKQREARSYMQTEAGPSWN